MGGDVRLGKPFKVPFQHDAGGNQNGTRVNNIWSATYLVTVVGSLPIIASRHAHIPPKLYSAAATWHSRCKRRSERKRETKVCKNSENGKRLGNIPLDIQRSGTFDEEAPCSTVSIT